MKLSTFISQHAELIIGEWESFAMTLLPAAESMSSLQLRDHSNEILQAIVADIEAMQSDAQRYDKSRGLGTVTPSPQTAAATHGALRHGDGFDLEQLSAEFRALRHSVLRLWMASGPPEDDGSLADILRFNEAVDQALAESIVRYQQEVERSRNMFLAILGHDLRTPLGAIMMTVQYLRLPNLPAQKQADAVSRLERSAMSMGAMIRDLLEFTRSRLGNGIPIAPQSLDLDGICQGALEEVRTAHPYQEFRLETVGDPGITADADRLKQLLWNLLVNAVQHGGREFPVTLRRYGDSEKVVLEVRNFGPPIPADAAQVIFNPLMRHLEEGRAGPAANLGLGLFIAREIVHAHGGNIDVTSSAQAGTVFTVTLPRHAPQG